MLGSKKPQKLTTKRTKPAGRAAAKNVKYEAAKKGEKPPKKP